MWSTAPSGFRDFEISRALWGTLLQFLPKQIPGAKAPRCWTSTWIAAVGDGAVADGGDANRLPAIGQLVEDSIRADPQRIEPAEPTLERMPCLRLSLQQPQGILDSVDQRPAQLEQLAASAAGEDEPRQ